MYFVRYLLCYFFIVSYLLCCVRYVFIFYVVIYLFR